MIRLLTPLLFKTCILFLLAVPFITYGQSDSLTYADLKNGEFHVYPKNTNGHLIIRMEEKVYKEINPKTGDSTVWKINWNKDCSYYIISYRSGSYRMDFKREQFYKQHNFVYKILSLTKDYYIIEGRVDALGNKPFQLDTVWLKPKAVTPNNLVYKKVKDLQLLQNLPFTDTSKYAILHTYRASKFTCEGGSVLVYFNNDIMFGAGDRSKDAFIFLKEGQYNLRAVAGGKEITFALDVKFGKKYYLKVGMKGAVFCSPELVPVDAEEGQKHFDK